MTSLVGRNADADKPSKRKYHLRANKNGFPLNKQVPRTIQEYNGQGGLGVSVNYDGSNDFVVYASNLTGDLIIVLCPSSINDRFNLLGKEMKLHINGPTTRSITLNSSPAFMKINATGLTQLSHVIAGDGLSKTLTLSFTSLDLWNLDYGAAAIYTFPTSLPAMSYQRVSYVYGILTGVVVPSIYIPDDSIYSVQFGELNRDSEGYIVDGSFTLTVQGPGQQNIAFAYLPATGRTEPTNVYGYIYQGSVYFGSFVVQLSPILNNVYDFPFFVGANTAGTLGMFRLDDTDVSKLANSATGNLVSLAANLRSIATSISDSMVYYVLSTSPTIIRYRGFLTNTFAGILVDVSTLIGNYWTAAAQITDIEFDEKNRCLYVLPNGSSNLLLRISILPQDEVNDFLGGPRTGQFTSRTLSFSVGSTLFSIAVCPYTSALFIATRPSAGNNTINIFLDFDNSSSAHILPSVINTGAMAIGFTASGKFIIHYETNRQVLTLIEGRPLSSADGGTVVVSKLTTFCPSLSRTCYGWTQI